MTRLDLLRMKRTASSYGAPLTLLEQLELDRLEAEIDDLRHGRSVAADEPHGGSIATPFLVAAVTYEG
jgi:hypothetical protein